MTDLEADVCIVGAGYSGLTAAWRLHQAGRRVVALEARERIGGRVFTELRPDGSFLDRGAGWIGPGQDRIYALAAELGVPTYPQYVEGESLLDLRGRVHRYRGRALKGLSPFALASFGLGFLRLDRMSRRIPIDEPWTARDARRLDALTFETWVTRPWNVPSPVARDMLRTVFEGLFAADTTELSMLHVLFHLHAAGGIEFQTTIEGGAEQDRILGGMGAVLDRITEKLGDAVRLGTPVCAIAQDAAGVRVVGEGVAVRAQHVVVAVPPWLSGQIRYSPILDADRALLTQRTPAGFAVKVALVFAEPFWRNDGLSGESLGVGSPVTLTIDGCGPTPAPAILHAFLSGPHAQRFGRLPPSERRCVVLDALVPRFGPRVRTPDEYVENCFANEEWTRGCYMTHFPPGVLTSFGRALRAPVGRIHWAGTETATRSNGFVDGAVRAGERAAAEVLAQQGSRR